MALIYHTTTEMDSQPLLPKSINVSEITFGAMRSLESGGKMVPVGINGKPLYIQTPEMSSPFGISKWNTDKADKEKYTIELSFKNKDTNKSQEYFYNFLSELDKKFIEEAMNNSTSWFKKKITTPEVVEALYTHLVKHPKDKETGEVTDKYPPTFRLNLPTKDGVFAFQIYDKDRKLMENVSTIEKGTKMKMIIKCTGLWVAGGKFGCSWRIEQALLSPPSVLKGFAFRDDDDIEVKNENSDFDADEDECGVQEQRENNIEDTGSLIESSDDDDDDEIEMKSKVVKKKK